MRPWRSERPPASILSIRLQALGDVVITLPYLRALQSSLPSTAIDAVVRAQDAELLRGIDLFRRVHVLGGGRDERQQLLRTPLLAPALFRRYDVVLDLQNNRVSRTLRRLASPRAWSSFDRESPISAGERTRRAIEAVGFPLDEVSAGLPMKNPSAGDHVLRDAGWRGTEPVVILSPAGQFVTRNWPLDRYIEFADTWHARHGARFVMLGIGKIRDKAATLKARLGDRLIDLVGQTTAIEALAIVQRASLVVTEDCGLMHMAWTSGVPTLALFGSSRHDWSAPQGNHTVCLHSGDLECGACWQPSCRFGDVHCLTRYETQRVVAEAEALLDRVHKDTKRVIYLKSRELRTQPLEIPSPEPRLSTPAQGALSDAEGRTPDIRHNR